MKKYKRDLIILSILIIIFVGIVIGIKLAPSYYFINASEQNSQIKVKEENVSDDVKLPELADSKEVCLKDAQERLDTIGGESEMTLELYLKYMKYSDSDIAYALSNINVDWTKQAIIYTKDLYNMGYSKTEAISELLGYGFSKEATTEAIDSVY